MGIALWTFDAHADTSTSAVTKSVVAPGQSYPEVPVNGEGWFDVGGYCKVVDVGDLSSLSPTATGVPVFIPGPTAPIDQWENYRTMAPSDYQGHVLLTTCCRPQSNVATLCTEDGATPVPVSRQYGKIGETDTVTATCTGNNGPYQDSVSVTCSGDNGPDGQAIWSEGGPDTPSCTTAPATTYGACSTAGVGGWGNQLVTVTNCLGQVLSQSYSGPSCYTAPPCTPSYSYACNGASYVRTDNNGCSGPATVGVCTLTATSGTRSCSPDYNDSYPDGTNCSISYYQCSNDASSQWSCTSGDCSGTCTSDQPDGCYLTSLSGSGCTQSSGGKTCPVTSQSCSGSYWAPP